MAEELTWTYDKLSEDGKIETVGPNKNDFDGKITGKIIFGVKEYFDENPAERIRLGWTKHIHHKAKDIEYDHQTQYLVRSIKTIDAYTVEDEWKVMDKSAEMMRLQELNGVDWIYSEDAIIYGGAE